MHLTDSALRLYNSTTQTWDFTDQDLSQDESQFLKHLESRRKNNKDAQIAYFCLVFLLCLMLLCMYLLRGFHSRHTNKKDPASLYFEHLPTVKEVIFAKAKYLPMFQKDDSLITVYVHDCGNDP